MILTAKSGKCMNCKSRQVKLMPDHCSTGLWCGKCGIMLDEDNTNLPKELLTKIQEWNDLWSKEMDTNNRLPQEFNTMGLALAKEISQYHPCLLFISKE